MYEINKNVKITISRNYDANFDRACDEAYHVTCTKFGLDEDGYCKYVKDWNRSTDIIIIEFNNYRRIGTMAGQKHNYIFIARIERNNEKYKDI